MKNKHSYVKPLSSGIPVTSQGGVPACGQQQVASGEVEVGDRCGFAVIRPKQQLLGVIRQVNVARRCGEVVHLHVIESLRGVP